MNRYTIFTVAILSVLLTSACIKVNITTAEQGPSGSGNPKYVFEMTDGYFQSNGWPVHLVHEPLNKQNVWLGGDFSLMIKIVLSTDAKSPCTRRGEKKCTEILELVGKDENSQDKIWTHWKKDDQFDGTSSLSVSIPNGISRKVALGNATIRYRIIYGEETLFSYEIPIEIN